MMKIHTTQNLNSLGRLKSTDNDTIPNEEIRLNYLNNQTKMQNLYDHPDSFEHNVSFRKKGNPVKDSKKILTAVAKKVGEVSKKGQPEKKRGDRIYQSPLFNRALEMSEYETVITAIIAAGACAARAGTIALFPAKDENTKINNKYAIGHSLASGIVGFFTAIILTAPFKKGANYTTKVLKKNLSDKTLKRLHPQLDISSIGSKEARKGINEWKNVGGLDFCSEIKNCAKIPELKQLADVSEETFKNILKVDVDWAAQKGKSFNDVVLKDGSKLYDKIDMSRLGIVVKEDGYKDAHILFKDMSKDYIQKLVKDSKGTKWEKLDINSVYDKNNEVVDFRKWKDINGQEWKLDLDKVSVSSPYETAQYTPRTNGDKLFDKSEKVYKYQTFQINGKDDKLGTPITAEMLYAESQNEVLDKALTWGPDLLFRIPVAMGTVALIPWVLEHCLGLKKAQKKAPESPVQKLTVPNDNATANNVAFKGKAPSKDSWWITRILGKYYGKPLLESESVAKVTGSLTKLPGRMTQHMSVAGSFLTSGMYVQQTLTKKELDPDKRRTLAINQTLGFFVPTIAGYIVNNAINDLVKKREYRYSGIQQRNIDLARLQGKPVKDIESMLSGLGKRLKGVRILADLLTFTLIYRYAVPVIITPFANKIGDRINAKKAAKRAKMAEMNKEIKLEPQTNTKDIKLEPQVSGNEKPKIA